MQRAIEIGPTGQYVAKNILRLRKASALTVRALSKRLLEAGRSIPPSGLTKMELGERRVDVDDLVALAVAFGVSPSALMLPLTDAPDETVEVTGAGQVQASTAWDWADGQRPLALDDDSPASDQRYMHALYSRPPYRRNKTIDREQPQGVVERTSDDVSLVFGRLVREARKRRGWTQTSLASKLGDALGADVNALTICRIELGKRPVSISEVAALASLLGLSVDALLRGTQCESF